MSDFIDAMMMGVSGAGTVPTIIFEIEIRVKRIEKFHPFDGIVDGIENIKRIAKELSTVCSVILILSEANAALEFGRDPHRETFIFVGEFTELEAREYMTKILKLKLSDADIKHVLDNIGANPTAL